LKQITIRRPAFNAVALLWAGLFIAGALAGPMPERDPSRAGFSPERLARVHAFAQSLVNEGKYAGLNILIARDGRIVDWQSFGGRNREGAPLKKDDVYAIASLTKLVTTVGVLMLVEEGKVGLNDPIGNFIPEFNKMKVRAGGSDETPVLVDAVRPITITHLLTHTSGVTNAGVLADRADSRPVTKWGEYTRLEDAAKSVARFPLAHQPGEAWTYGVSTDVLGCLIEIVSGKPFDLFLDERIFRPLKMRDTSFVVPPEKRLRQVAMDVRQTNGVLKEIPAKPHGSRWPSGAGGLYSTQGDYIRFAQMLLNRGELDGVRLLSPKTIELMTADHLFGLAKPTKIYPVSDGFGLGVEIRTDPARAGWLGSQGTYGWNGATTAYCSIDPKERLIAMIWAQHTPNAEFQLYEHFNNLVYQALVR
jgi:CubicO group peptidase (beta-lactamase class C family)